MSIAENLTTIKNLTDSDEQEISDIYSTRPKRLRIIVYNNVMHLLRNCVIGEPGKPHKLKKQIQRNLGFYIHIQLFQKILLPISRWIDCREFNTIYFSVLNSIYSRFWY